MELKTGAKLGPYEILSPIGAGGMGQVWKARDTRLGRTVAIKVSAAKFSERFAQEARAIAALNHPNICTLYDVGPDYLVMEYVEGQEIKGPLPLDQALALAIQLAGALEAAHRKGITHRDLKPANILTTKSGVKVLDFGLAKVAQTKEAAANDETVTRALTQEGSIVGTLQYMAPEQLQGKATDARADIFSFGCVLYEMLTGERAFDGANAASVIAAVMEREAPSVAEVAPAALDRVVKKCLAKDPDERWQTARDLRDELMWIAGGGTEVPLQAEARPTWFPWAAAALLGLTAVSLAVVHLREKPAEFPTLRYTIAAPEKTSLQVGGIGVNPFSVSPDGRRLVFRTQTSDGKNQLWVRSLDSLAAQPLAEGGADPFWSPDSKSIGFSAGGKVKKLDLAGGPALALADNGPYGGAWGSQGVIIFPQKGGGALVRIPASGGSPIPVTKWAKGEPQHAYPWFLPDGRHFLFVTLSAGPTGHYQISIGSLDSLESKALLEADSTAIYSEGRLLFVRESTLMAQPFDPKRLATTGEAVPVAEHVRRISAFPAAIFSASAGGLLAYSAYSADESAGGFSLTWLDRSGARLSTLGDPRSYLFPNFSPDRKSLAVRIVPNGNSGSDIWVFDVARGVRTRFTFDTAEYVAIWSPDGRTIVYSSRKSGHFDLYRKASDGTSAEELLYSDDHDKQPTSWSPDGKFLLYQTGGNTWVLSLTPEKPGAPLKPFLFAPTAINGTNAQFSPDGRWVSYQSNESGRTEIYAAPFPGPGGKRQVSLAGGTLARWRRDGKEIFFIAPDRKLMAAEVNMQGAALEMGAVHPLFGLVTSFLGYNYDVSLDGQKFLAVVAPEQQGPEALLTVVQNWTAGLKK